MTPQERKVMELALEALEMLHDENMDYLTRNKLGGENNQCMVFARDVIKSISRALAQPEQEPAFWLNEQGQLYATKGDTERHSIGQKIIPLYTTPPKQKWVGMSEEEKIQFMVAYYSSNWDTKTLIAVMDNYEAQLRSKNTRGKE